MYDLHFLVTKILHEGFLLSLASVDESGLWVSDVIYTFDSKLNLYWISQTKSRHSKAFVTNPKAAGAITTVEKPEGKGVGVQCEGTVTREEKIPQEAHANYTKKRNRTGLWQPGPGEAWYKLTPTKFDIINEPLFGLTKKTFTLP